MKLISLIAFFACLAITIRASAEQETADLLEDVDVTPSFEAMVLQRAFCIPNDGVRLCYSNEDCCSLCCDPEQKD